MLKSLLSITSFDPGELLSEHYRYKEAAEMLLEAAEMNPASVSLAAAAGHALHDAKRDFEAELLFRRAVSLDPSVRRVNR